MDTEIEYHPDAEYPTLHYNLHLHEYLVTAHFQVS